MEGLKGIIREHPFFQSFAPKHLDLIVGCASNHTLKKGEFLFREGKPAEEFFLLRQGRVALECNVPQRGPLVLETIEEGEVLGWSWLLPPGRWHVDAHAATDLRYLSFRVSCLTEKMRNDAELGYALTTRFLPVIVRRLEATQAQLVDLYGRPHPAEKGFHVGRP